jgi:hypothetical protein
MVCLILIQHKYGRRPSERKNLRHEATHCQAAAY